MGAIAFHLLLRRDGAEDDLGKLATLEGTVGDSSVTNQLGEVRFARRVSAYPTTSRGCFIMAMEKWVRS